MNTTLESGMKVLSVEETEMVGGGFWGWLAAGVILGGVLWGVANFVKDVIIEGEPFDMTRW
jgi:hypothetical protein